MSKVITPRNDVNEDEYLWSFDIKNGWWGSEPVEAFVKSELIQSVSEQGHPSLSRVSQLIASSATLWFDGDELVIVKRSDGRLFGVSYLVQGGQLT